MAVTLLQLRSAAKDICDYQNNPQVSDTTWNNWINDGIERLYRIVYKLDAGAFQTSAPFTLTAASNTFPKPAGWRRTIGVSLDPSSPSMRRSLPKYMFGERDSLGQFGPRSYHMIGQNLVIEPFQLCAGNYALYYVSGPTILAADADLIDAVLEPYDDYVTTWAAIRALGKEESDNRDLYTDLAGIEQSVIEMFAMSDGDDPSTIVDVDMRGPAVFTVP